MTRIVAPKRRRKAIKRLDVAQLRHLLKDGRFWTGFGIVETPDGETTHFELVPSTDGGSIVDVLVDVSIMPDGMELTCSLGVTEGVWSIPPVGAEVAVLVPNGDIEFLPVIVAVLDSAGVPNSGGQGVAVGRTVITNGEVFIHDGDGGAEELVKKSAYEAHKHPTGTGPSGVADNALTSTSYTSVLKAK